MSGGRAERIEAAVDRIAAGLFAGAAGYAAFCFLEGAYAPLQVGAFAAIVAAISFVLVARILRRVTPGERRFDVASFAVVPLAQADLEELLLTEQVELLLTDPVELVLTDADRVRPAEPLASDELLLTDTERLRSELTRTHEELVLDDVLAELGPDSRVVRLFDPAAMPTADELNSKIERHLGDAPAPEKPDASQALYDALAELRRSLR